MKLLILYRSNSEHTSAVEAFVRDFQYRYTSGHVEVVNVDSRDGIATATLYDVMSYPAILALRNDGTLLKSWEGEMLPMMDEVAYYATQES